MANVLQTIVADKRIEVAQREQDFPLETFKAQLVPSTKSLFENLNQQRVGFIFECKKASPSKGLIREKFDLDEILDAYLPYAAGISVLTDEKYFQGTYEYLAYVTERATVPVLNKDFFVSSYQVYLARHYNADAILLMLSVLSDEEYVELATLAESLKLDILTEVSNEQEMLRAIHLRAKIIGINNRNLRDLTTDLATTEKLVPMLSQADHEFVVISESGIYTHEDVKRLSPISNGFLVGSSLMAQADLANAVRQLVFGDNKVCGITRAQDAAAALQAGATHLGLIFVESSPRYVSIEQAKAITHLSEANYVGVFRNHSMEQILACVEALPLCAVQLHGNEDAAFRQQLKSLLPENVALWQASALSKTPSNEELSKAAALLNETHCDKVLFDCKVGNNEGGTGESFDWAVLDSLKHKQKWVLAGGIGAHNVSQAKSLSPTLLDMNSCVEVSPGIKSEQALQHTLEQTRCLAATAR